MRGRTMLGILLSVVLALAVTMDATAQQCPKGKLRIYTSWPMQGAMIPEGTGMKNGLDMAIAEAGGVAGGHYPEIAKPRHASPPTGTGDPGVGAPKTKKDRAEPPPVPHSRTP